jgi:hypothetical protein
MIRRSFLAFCITALIPNNSFASRRRFVFKIRTKTGGIVGNILIEAKDIFAAITKLQKRYPGCQILEGRER